MVILEKISAIFRNISGYKFKKFLEKILLRFRRTLRKFRVNGKILVYFRKHF